MHELAHLLDGEEVVEVDVGFAGSEAAQMRLVWAVAIEVKLHGSGEGLNECANALPVKHASNPEDFLGRSGHRRGLRGIAWRNEIAPEVVI